MTITFLILILLALIALRLRQLKREQDRAFEEMRHLVAMRASANMEQARRN